jgi:UDP-N-acetylglucosamine--N-acetylmuramyl-(pentapeptide) pyrophosphoryl-undecaprenol N-acetylglucosamine transferase
MPAAAKLLLARLPGLTIVHQAGAKNLEDAKAAYLKEGLDSRIQIVPFLDDVAGAMAASHLLVSRAGAITIAEICAAGRPSVLVPLAIAKAHQMDNARLLVEAGGAVVIPSEQFSPERLADQVAGLFSGVAGGPALEAMGRAAHSLARPRAAADIADHLEELGGAR